MPDARIGFLTCKAGFADLFAHYHYVDGWPPMSALHYLDTVFVKPGWLRCVCHFSSDPSKMLKAVCYHSESRVNSHVLLCFYESLNPHGPEVNSKRLL